MNLDGSFTVRAKATFTVHGDNFSAAATTSQIGRVSEAHNLTINSTRSGDTYTVTNSVFTIAVSSSTENINIITGTFTVNESAMSGSGNMTDSATPNPGKFTLTGTK